MIENHYTIRELSSQLGVSVQRTHVLLRTYGVQAIHLHPRFLLVPASEAKKIPRDRQRPKVKPRK